MDRTEELGHIALPEQIDISETPNLSDSMSPPYHTYPEPNCGALSAITVSKPETKPAAGRVKIQPPKM